MGLNGVKSIKFSKNTLFTTHFFVPALKGTNNVVIGYLLFQEIGRFLEPKTVLWTFFASCSLLHGTIWYWVHYIIGGRLLATSFVVSVLKEKRKMALSVICAFIKLESIFDCFRTLLHRIASNYLKVTTKKALWVIRTCNKLEGFCYQKQCFGLFLHLVHCCVGIVGVTLLHLVKIHCLQLVLWYPPCLKNQRKRRYGLLLLAINWKVFGTKNSALDWFSHPVHCGMGLIGVKSITFSQNTLFTTSFVVPVLKGSNNGVIG